MSELQVSAEVSADAEALAAEDGREDTDVGGAAVTAPPIRPAKAESSVLTLEAKSAAPPAPF